jgi:hypothetical protein
LSIADGRFTIVATLFGPHRVQSPEGDLIHNDPLGDYGVPAGWKSASPTAKLQCNVFQIDKHLHFRPALWTNHKLIH